MMYCIILYCIVLYCIVLYCIVLYCIVFCREVVLQLEDNDFIVLDGVLKQSTVNSITNFLLKSTIWFDVTNGGALAAHFDDSPIDQSIVLLTKLLASALSTDGEPPLQVVRAFSLAMNISTTRSGPIAAGTCSIIYNIIQYFQS